MNSLHEQVLTAKLASAEAKTRIHATRVDTAVVAWQKSIRHVEKLKERLDELARIE